MNKLRRWVHHRARHGPSTHAHISKQRRFALWMTVFAGVRVVAWTACMLLIIAYALGVKGSFILGFVRLSSLVLWVSFISYYCNAATDFASFMAGVSALFSADSHATAVAAGGGPAEDIAQALSANADVLARLDVLDGKLAGLAQAATADDLAGLLDEVKAVRALVTPAAPVPAAAPGSAGTAGAKTPPRGGKQP